MYPNMPYYGNQFNQGNYGFNPQVPNTQTKQEIKRVHGRPGAEAFYLGPNESALLLDDTGPIVWFKATDSAGYPTTCTPYDLTPHKEQEAIAQEIVSNDYSALEERISRLERRLNNGKSYSGNARQTQPARPASPAKPAEPAEPAI